MQREVFSAEDTNESFDYRTRDPASNASDYTASRICQLYWPMRRLIGYRLKEFGRDGMLQWVPVAENSRSTELLHDGARRSESIEDVQLQGCPV